MKREPSLLDEALRVLRESTPQELLEDAAAVIFLFTMCALFVWIGAIFF